MEGLTLEPSDSVRKLIVDTPDFFSNHEGKVARKALVSVLKASTPGRHSEPYGRKGDTFRDIFFPNYSSAKYSGDVVEHTGLSESWWSDFSVAVLCQSMYHQTSDLRSQLKKDKINGAVDDYNSTLRKAAVRWYSHVLLRNYISYEGDRSAAKTTYIKQICTETWVTFKMKQYNDGTWANPAWELFHHWVKLSALGASDHEISTVINRLRDLGLRILPDVDVSTWKHYLVWYTPDAVNHNDVDSDARGGETREVYIPSSSGFGSSMKEDNSFEFTAHGQPGSKYRSASSSCCFSPTTQVLLPDGSTKEISTIKAGDQVHTPSGPRQVLLVSTPLRNGRTLYSVNQMPGFNFSSTHPFLNGQRDTQGEPNFLAVSPLGLIRTVPLISYEGVGRLNEGAQLVGFEAGFYHPLRVKSVEEFPSDLNDELLYDLILKPDTSGQFEYIVGAEGSLVVVASELPAFRRSTIAEMLAGSVILSSISTASQELQILLHLHGQHLFSGKIDNIALWFSSSFLPLASSLQLTGTSPTLPQLKMVDLPDFVQYILSRMEMFTSSDGIYSAATGEAFAYLAARLCHQLASALQLGCRIIHEQTKPDVVAVSLLDLQITASHPHLSLVNPIITVNLDNLSSLLLNIKDNNTPFGIRIYKTLYFPLQNTSEHCLDIQIDNGTEVLQASTYISLPLQLNYRHYRLPVFRDQEERGILSTDIRFLSECEVIEETKSCANWDETKMLVLAQHYAKVGGELLQKLHQTNTT